MAATQTTVFLAEFETKTALEVEPRPAGTYRTKMMIRCNSILSSIYIKDCDPGATIKANYWDTTSGDEKTGERYDLLSHDEYSAANIGGTYRILVTRIHNKPQLEVIVTGGSATFGVYATAVSSSASDIDSALVRDGQEFKPADTKALPLACVNDETNTLHLLRCPLRVEVINDITLGDGDYFHFSGIEDAVPGGEVTLISGTVPAGTERRLRKLVVVATNDGYFSLTEDGTEIAAGRLDAACHNLPFVFDPAHRISPGGVYALKYTADEEPSVSCPVRAFMSGYDVALV